MLTFDAPLFAFAGLMAAAGPIIVHLLNRRRFRVVAWGAMEFLREAMERHRRSLQFRDLILLILRVLAVCLFGMALARPYLQGSLTTGVASTGLFLLLCIAAAVAGAAFAVARQPRERWISGALSAAALGGVVALWGWSASDSGSDGLAVSTARAPVHAVLVVDNSRSMGVASAAGTRLDRAKQMARQFLDELPPESRITVIPGAGSEQPFPLDAFVSKTDASRALDQIALVDAADDVAASLEQAELACQQVSDPEAKRVVVLSDLQSDRWIKIDWDSWGKRLPGMQVVPVSEGGASNLAITSRELEDGFAGAEAPSRFLARIHAEGLEASTSVEAVLRVDGVTTGSQVLELADGQTRELEFSHRFDVGGEPGRPQWATVTLELRPEDVSADRLAADNTATILSAVLDSVPVVFVDQYGAAEDLSRGRLGETHALRHLLAPRVADDETPRRLIRVEHVRPEAVTPELLETARLVVIAGVESPEGLTPTLRDYVVQGGPLVLLAGGNFDPDAWHRHAWLDGRGILPVSLQSELLGSLPTAAGKLEPFFADFTSLTGRDFRIDGEDLETLSSLFDSTPFFQAVRTDVSAGALQLLAQDELTAWQTELSFLKEQAGNAEATLGANARDRLRRLEPSWWTWRSPLPIYPANLTAEQIVERERPQVQATFTGNGLPWVIQRRLGRGTVLFFTSGVSSDWNLLRTSGAMYVFHRTLFRLMTDTLPKRNSVAGDRLTLPQVSGDARWELERPGGRKEPLTPEALDAGVTGLVVRRPVSSGLYAIQALKSGLAAESAPNAVATPPLAMWAVQGPASESELTGSSLSAVRSAMGNAAVRVLSVGEPIRLEGGARRGERLWKWAILGVLLGLTAEMALLAAPNWRRAAA